MKQYTLVIKSENLILYKETHGFESLQLAQTYHLGLMQGFSICGKNPTRMELKEIKQP